TYRFSNTPSAESSGHHLTLGDKYLRSWPTPIPVEEPRGPIPPCLLPPSCRQRLIQFLHDAFESVAENLRRPRQAPFGRERSQVKAVHVNLQTRRDVVAHHPEPLHLLF